MQIYRVGGSVRDELLGLPVKDRDWVVVGATPEQMSTLGYLPVGKDFPVFLHPQTREEYALARTERKTARGYKGFAIHTSPEVTLEEDLARRDLTINSIAVMTILRWEPAKMRQENDLIDPYGGQRDLQARVLRHVTDAFREDPVRILRVARFAARFSDFRVAPETLQLMREMVQHGEADHLVAERVWQELARGLMEATPSRLFDVLIECGALKVLLPEAGPPVGRAAARRLPPRDRHRRAPDDGAGHERAPAGAAGRCALPAWCTTWARAPRPPTCCRATSATRSAA
jgi:tRNA nucleotidyltransferase (CCA-adding enzyme)